MPPPAAMNPAAIHTMHHSSAVTNPGGAINHPSNNSFQHGSQYYQANLIGFRSYLNTLESTKPSLYTTLDAKLTKLEQKNKTANIISTVALIGSLAAFAQGPDGNIYAPIGIFALGSGVSYLVRPKPEDYLQFINEHNRLNPENGLNLSINGTQKNDGIGLQLAYNF